MWFWKDINRGKLKEKGPWADLKKPLESDYKNKAGAIIDWLMKHGMTVEKTWTEWTVW